jgi:hypothetical protein
VVSLTGRRMEGEGSPILLLLEEEEEDDGGELSETLLLSLPPESWEVML